MTFVSTAVSLEWNRNSLVLKRGTSMLMIEVDNVNVLRTLKDKVEFNDFFKTKALVNREARRVFESWERKDTALLDKLHIEMTN